MTHELLNILLPIGKYLLAAALMLVFYRLGFKDRSSYNESRFYLTSIVLVSILVSQFKVVVYTPPTRIVEVEALNTVVTSIPATLSQLPVSKAVTLWNLSNLLLALYVVVTLLLFISLLSQYLQIYRLKKHGTAEFKEGYSIIENPAVPTPFSFGRNIFLGLELTGDKREMIVHHESWHIKHGHFVDVFLMEIMARLFWFNPIVWMVRKELRSIHEFQTDRSVLQEGYDLFHYQTIILEEVMGNHSCLANGFNQSFTKKRFIMMKNTNPFRFSTLRQVALIPFLVAVFCLLSFTKGQGQVTYVDKPARVAQKDSSSVSKNRNALIITKTDNPDLALISNQGEKSSITISDSLLNSISEEDNQKSLKDRLDKIQGSIDVYKKLVEKTDFSQNGVEVGAILNSIGTIHREDGTIMDGTMLSERFLATIKQSDIQQALVVMNDFKENVHQLYTSNAPTKDKVRRYHDLFFAYRMNDFIHKIFIEAAMFRLPYGAKTISKTESQLKGAEIAVFKLKIERLEDRSVRLTGLEGCNYQKLTYLNPSFNQLIDENGMLNKNEMRNSNYIFEVSWNRDGMTLIGIKGMSWSKIFITGPHGDCSQVINQNGAVN